MNLFSMNIREQWVCQKNPFL